MIVEEVEGRVCDGVIRLAAHSPYPASHSAHAVTSESTDNTTVDAVKCTVTAILS